MSANGDYYDSDRRMNRDDSSRDHASTEQNNEKTANNPGNNIYVSNLSINTTDEGLRDYFAAYGELLHCQIVKEPLTASSRGFAFIAFARVDDSERAISELNGSMLDGRNIKVEKAKRGGGYEKTPGRYLGPPLQRQPMRAYDRGRSNDVRDRQYDERDRDRDYGRPRTDDYDYRSRDRDMRGPPAYDRRDMGYADSRGGGRGGYDDFPDSRRGGYAYDAPAYDRDRRPPPRDDYRRDEYRRDDYRGMPPSDRGGRY